MEGVKRFQAWQGLGADGVIGQATRDWLNVSPAQRAGVLALNIQRLRLLPGNLATGIMVNIPAFSLVYYQDGSQVLASRVIVGPSGPQNPYDEQCAEQRCGQPAVERSADAGAQRYSAEGAQ